MKKYIYLLPILAIALISCGGGDSTDQTENASEETTEMAGVLTDLSQYGMNYTIVLPDKKNVETEITATDWGSVEIRQGNMFMISIGFGEGDIDLLKFDLEEDLVYKSQILEESPNHLVYKREIQDSGMEPEYHFLYVMRLTGDAIEIQNLKDATFNEESIKTMLQSAQSLKAKSES